ncbi:MAG: hypothetical protein AAF974_03450 [Cyanobacteria bacterium P01_E01_bin.34]
MLLVLPSEISRALIETPWGIIRGIRYGEKIYLRKASYHLASLSLDSLSLNQQSNRLLLEEPLCYSVWEYVPSSQVLSVIEPQLQTDPAQSDRSQTERSQSQPSLPSGAALQKWFSQAVRKASRTQQEDGVRRTDGFLARSLQAIRQSRL